MSWHDHACEDLKLAWHGGVPACDTCSSSAFSVMEDTIETSPLPPPPKAPKRSQLKLSWPPCVEYSGHFIDEDGNNETAFIIENIDQKGTFPEPVEMERHGEPASESSREGTNGGNRRIESSVGADIPSRTDHPMESSWTGRSKHTLETLYGHLPKSNGLRLLFLHGAESFHAPVHCSLVVTALDDPEIPPYEALSYTWADLDGDKRNCIPIFIGPQYQVLLVTRNCESALRSLRTRYDRVLWVDAICINQHDSLERQFQVGLMPKLYNTAARVVIYLGEERNTSKKAMRAVVAHSTSQEDNRESFSHLLERPYFRRIWVIQEIAHAQKASVICGKETVHWTSLCSAFQSCKLDLTWINHFSFPKRDSRNSPGLLQLLIDTRDSDCADPRDRVYGLIGLVHPDEAKLFPVDYSLSVQQVYTGLAAYWAKQPEGSPSFDFLLFAQSEKKISHLPTWVPDWSNLADRQGGAGGLRVSIDVTKILTPRPSWSIDAIETSSSRGSRQIYTDGSKQGSDQSHSLKIANYDKAHMGRQIRVAGNLGFTYNIKSPVIQSDVGSLVTDGYRLFRYSHRTLEFAGRHKHGFHIDHAKFDGLPRLLDSEQPLEIFYFPRWHKSLVLRRNADPIFSVAGSFSVDVFSSDRGQRTTPGFRTLEEAIDHMRPHEASLILSWRAAVNFFQECLFSTSEHANSQIELFDLLKYTVNRRTLASATQPPIMHSHLMLMEEMRTQMLQSLTSSGVNKIYPLVRPQPMIFLDSERLNIRSGFEKSFYEAIPEWACLEGQPEDLLTSWMKDVTRLKAFAARGKYEEAFRNAYGRYCPAWSISGQSPFGPSLRKDGVYIDGGEIFNEAYLQLKTASLDGNRSWNWNRDRFWICLLSFDLIARLGEFLYNRQILSLLQDTISDGELARVMLI